MSFKSIKHENDLFSYEIANVFMHLITMIWNKACYKQYFDNKEELKQIKDDFVIISGMLLYLVEFIKNYELDNTLSDLNPSYLNVLQLLSITHINECLFIKAQTEKMNSILLSKICKKIYNHYNNCKLQLKSNKSTSTFIKDLNKYLDVKKNFYNSILNYYQGLDDLNNRKYGDYICRMKIVYDSLILSDITKRTNHKFVCDLEILMKDGYNTAMEDNKNIYHTKPTLIENLIDIEPTPNIPISTFLTDNIKQYINHETYVDSFQYLHSTAITKVLAHLEHTRDTIITEKTLQIEQLNKDINNKLILYNLPICLEKCENNELPPSLLNKVDDFKNTGGINHVRKQMDNLKNTVLLNSDVIRCIRKSLEDEIILDVDFRKKYVDLQQIVDSNSLNKHYFENLNYIIDKIDQAKTADESLNLNFKQLNDNYMILENPLNYSSHNTNNKIGLTNVEKIELKRLYDNSIEIINKREEILQKYNIRQDRTQDIYLLMKERPNEDSSLWASQLVLKDYSDINLLLQDNIKEQDLLIHQLDNFVSISKLTTQDENNLIFQQVSQQYNLFLEICRHLNQGIVFHEKIREIILKLQDQVNDFVKSRELEKKLYIERKNTSQHEISHNQSINSNIDYRNSSSGSLNSSFYGGSANQSQNARCINFFFDSFL